MPLEGPLSETILAALVWSPEFCKDFAAQIKPEMFHVEPFRDMAEAAKEHYDAYGKPAGSHLDEHEPITTKLREPKSQETYGDLIRRMSEHRDLIDISYTSQRAQDFLDEAALQSMTVDAVEYAQSHGAKAGIARLKERIEQNEQRQARSSLILPNTRDLLKKVLPPREWVVDRFIVSGFTLVQGPAKAGKSHLVTNIAVAARTGAKYLGEEVMQGEVIMLASQLDDTDFQAMLFKMTRDVDIHYFYQPPPIEDDFMGWLSKRLEVYPAVRLVTIDLIGSILGSSRRNETQYQYDLRVLEPFARFCRDRRIAILAVHHTTKGTGDPIARTRGSSGAAGTYDTIITLEPNLDDPLEQTARMLGNCRHGPGYDKLLYFDEPTGIWSLVGDYRVSSPAARETISDKIIEVLTRSHSPDGRRAPLHIRQIAEAISKPAGTTSTYLWMLKRKNLVQSDDFGMWTLFTPATQPLGNGEDRH